METIFHGQRAASFLWVTSIISLPPEAQRKQLFWICTNKRSCYYSNHRTLWESSPLTPANGSSLHPPSFPFLHQCRLPLDTTRWLVIWLHLRGWSRVNTSLCIYTLQELEDLVLAKAYERAAELILDHLLAWFPDSSLSSLKILLVSHFLHWWNNVVSFTSALCISFSPMSFCLEPTAWLNTTCRLLIPQLLLKCVKDKDNFIFRGKGVVLDTQGYHCVSPHGWKCRHIF